MRIPSLYAVKFCFSATFDFYVNQRAITSWKFWLPLTKNVLEVMSVIFKIRVPGQAMKIKPMSLILWPLFIQCIFWFPSHMAWRKHGSLSRCWCSLRVWGEGSRNCNKQAKNIFLVIIFAIVNINACNVFLVWCY